MRTTGYKGERSLPYSPVCKVVEWREHCGVAVEHGEKSGDTRLLSEERAPAGKKVWRTR
jgi:hypothetical protein